jgi:hypothetical protein
MTIWFDLRGSHRDREGKELPSQSATSLKRGSNLLKVALGPDSIVLGRLS